ncbi:MAG: L-threonylcarbamoyladenylate synthase [Phycisphaerales bacterium JB040]
MSAAPPASGPEAIAEGVRRLRAGRPVAFPTETVYGLGAIATDEDAVRRVFETKGRPADNPLIVHVADADMARACVARWTEHARALADAFWPGPLSLVLTRDASIPDIVTAGGDTVAVRCPRHPDALALLHALGEPLVGPSANPSGAVSPTTAAHVRAHWNESEVHVIDGGPCVVGLESTVLALSTESPTVLRPGDITPDRIASVLGVEVRVATGTASGAHPPASPGTRHPHYRPNAPVVVDPADAQAGEAVIVLPPDPAAAAARLYAALREADAGAPPRIAVRLDPSRDGSDPRWLAVLDRLNRASAPRARGG